MLQTIRNEAGEPLGVEHVYEPDPNDMQDWYDDLDRVVDEDGPFEGCCRAGDWDGPRRTPEDGDGFRPWTCAHCGEPVRDPDHFERETIGWYFLVLGFVSGVCDYVGRGETVAEACGLAGSFLTLDEEDPAVFADGIAEAWADMIADDSRPHTYPQVDSGRQHCARRVHVIAQPTDGRR